MSSTGAIVDLGEGFFPSSQVCLWNSGDAVKPGNESARRRKWVIQMIDRAMNDSTSLSIVVVLVGGTVDFFEFRASDGGFLDSTLRPDLTHINEMLKQNGRPRSFQFITEKLKRQHGLVKKRPLDPEFALKRESEVGGDGRVGDTGGVRVAKVPRNSGTPWFRTYKGFTGDQHLEQTELNVFQQWDLRKMLREKDNYPQML
jgi:hypothetical protein